MAKTLTKELQEQVDALYEALGNATGDAAHKLYNVLEPFAGQEVINEYKVQVTVTRTYSAEITVEAEDEDAAREAVGNLSAEAIIDETEDSDYGITDVSTSHDEDSVDIDGVEEA